MKIFEIYDEDNNISIGTLLYYQKEHTFIIELCDNLDEWTAPLLLTSFVKKGIHTIPRDISFLWVKGRIIPSGRQNIQSILKTHHLKEYDEMKFLELSEGRCSQDSMYIKPLEALPDYVAKRQFHGLSDCAVLSDHNILCFFRDDSIRKINLEELIQDDSTKLTMTLKQQLESVLKNDALFSSCKVGTGGYFITFNNSIDIPSENLYTSGISIPLSQNDFISYARNNLLDTTESCYVLECSRQNLSYMVKQKQLTPIKENMKGNIYSKGDVLRNMW